MGELGKIGRRNSLSLIFPPPVHLSKVWTVLIFDSYRQLKVNTIKYLKMIKPNTKPTYSFRNIKRDKSERFLILGVSEYNRWIPRKTKNLFGII